MTTPADERKACGYEACDCRGYCKQDRAASQTALHRITEADEDDVAASQPAQEIADFIGRQKPLPPDIAKVVADNLSSLYDGERRPAQEPAFGPPYTTDVQQCCEQPETCAEPCQPAQEPIGKITLHLGQNRVEVTLQQPYRAGFLHCPVYAAPPADTARADRIMELADEMAERFADKQSMRMHYPTALDAYLKARRALEAEVRKG